MDREVNVVQYSTIGSYKINGQTVLHNVGPGNICVGRNAGLSIIGGFLNTLVGENAGVNSDGNENTYIGGYAGINATNESQNTYIGNRSGALTSGGNENSYLGSFSGYNNRSGSRNTFMGTTSGFKNTTGDENTCIGNHSGYENTTGSLNTFIGNNANIPGAAVVNNASAIGANAIVTSDNTMILGDNEVSVGIGMSGAVPAAKLHVNRAFGTNYVTVPTGEKIENNDLATGVAYTGVSIGLEVLTTNRNIYNYGIYSDVADAKLNIAGGFITSAANATVNTAGSFYASNAPTNYGVRAYAPSGNTAVNNFAVHGVAPNAPPIVGGNYTGFNVGVYGEAPNNDVAIPFTALRGTWAGYFNGDLAYAGSIKNFSDSILKTNIQPFTKASNLLNQMKVHTFYFDTVTYSGFMNFPKNMQYGLLAQELETIAPTLVTNTVLPPNLDSLGNTITPTVPVKMIDQLGLIPILIAGHKEQQSLIDSLQQSLADLNAIVANCCTMIQQGNTGHRNNTPVTLENNLTIILEQNSPNPFKEETDIKYTLPLEIKNASIIFYDKNGRVINQVTLKDRGQGNVHIFAPDLSSGMYTYSLIADGQVIETKVMVKTK